MGDTPHSRKSHNSVYDTGNDSLLSSSYPGNKVKFKKTDAAPVEGSDNCEYKCNSVKYHFKKPFGLLGFMPDIMIPDDVFFMYMNYYLIIFSAMVKRLS